MANSLQHNPGNCLLTKESTVAAPCQQACPAGINIPRYIRLINAGKFDEALTVIREKIPFPSVCGHVCFHPCEAKCRLGEVVGSPIAINPLKRFVAERSTVTPVLKSAKPTGKRVAVIGSGPAGLTAAYYLATLGHSVTVFESLPEPGGMMHYGIPQYRLPRNILDREIEAIKKAGVEIKVNSPVKSPDTLLNSGYNAVFLALGAHKSVPMGLRGEKSQKVRDCVSFLRDVNSGKNVEVGSRVGVIGGGNAAIDSARTALRLGAKKATIIYRRSRTEMPASPEEIEAALQEGIEIVFLAAPRTLRSKNSTLNVKFQRMKLGKADASGRAKPEPIEGSDFEMKFDTLIAATGQQPDIPKKLDLALSNGNTIKIDTDTMMTSKLGVFAGGDAVSGPASVIEAIADGRRAASAIDRYLGGSGSIEHGLTPIGELPAILETPNFIYTAQRPEIPSLAVAERLSGFLEVESTLPPEAAVKEAKRCLRCSLPMTAIASECRACLMCQLVCSLSHESVLDPARAYIKVSKTLRPDGGIDIGISFTDKCDSCGLCSRYCVYGALLAGGVGIANQPESSSKQEAK